MFRSKLTRRLLAVGMIVLAVAVFRPVAAQQLWHELAGLPDLQQQLTDEQQRLLWLDTEQTRTRNRMARKQHLITLLIQGRGSLAETAEAFAQMFQEHRGCLQLLRNNYAGSTDYEKVLNNVLHYVQQQLQDWPEGQRQAVLTRLEAERRQLLLTPRPIAKIH
ncbi:MAG: hypothetical protein NZ703_12195 [Gemmataceae bacterium]|nr:hypothetical protein [Gemmataceae bacterium]MCS7271831.1 hypothetical protein [Gemmataceae bacterium]MDW8243870.1 hypothetical protein [Thermogemmata sp.]